MADNKILELLGDGLKKAVLFPNGEIIVNLEGKKLAVNNKVLSFDNIIDCSLYCKQEESEESMISRAVQTAINKDEPSSVSKTNFGSLVGRSLAGGAIAGIPGALLGGLTAKKETYDNSTKLASAKDVYSYNNKYTFIITTNNPLTPTISIEIINRDWIVREIESLFKIVLSGNIETISENDKQQYFNEIKQKAYQEKRNINLDDDFIQDYGVLTDYDAGGLFEQLYVNQPNNPAYKFYHFFFDSFKGTGDIDTFGVTPIRKYDHKFVLLCNKFKEEVTEYIAYIKNQDNDTSQVLLDDLLHDVKLYALFINGGYIDEIDESYKLILFLGDLIEQKFGPEKAVNFWGNAIRFYLLNNNAVMSFKDFDFTPYLEKCKNYKSFLSVIPEKEETDQFEESGTGCVLIPFFILISLSTTVLLSLLF